MKALRIIGGFLLGAVIGGATTATVMGKLDAHTGIYFVMTALGATLLAVGLSER